VSNSSTSDTDDIQPCAIQEDAAGDEADEVEVQPAGQKEATGGQPQVRASSIRTKARLSNEDPKLFRVVSGECASLAAG
jgi:hypothetical protein